MEGTRAPRDGPVGRTSGEQPARAVAHGGTELRTAHDLSAVATADTVIVRIESQKRHPLYGKTIRRTAKLQVHDEANDANVGDPVLQPGRADGGTVFFDEIGDVSPLFQTKILRVIQEGEIMRIGGMRPIKVDVRYITATNRDLRTACQRGTFREDLFYRLNVVQVVMPPLRDRREDIPVLAHYFLRTFAASHGKQVEEISSEALMHLMNYPYPGNVRELENILEHAVAVCNSNILSEIDLPSHIKGVPITVESELFEKTAPGGTEVFFSKGLSLDAELETHEKCILLAALKRANGVQKRAAEILGINYRSLRHRLDKYGLLNSKSISFTVDNTEAE